MPRANAAPGLPRGLARETDSGPKASPLVHSTAKSGKMRVPRRASRHAAACLPRGLARETRKWHEGPWVSCHFGAKGRLAFALLPRVITAMCDGWIQVYYQPVVMGMSRTLSGVEALARWIDPERGMIAPAKFIPVLEESGKIYEFDLYIVEQICKDYRLVTDARCLQARRLRDLDGRLRQRILVAGSPEGLYLRRDKDRHELPVEQQREVPHHHRIHGSHGEGHWCADARRGGRDRRAVPVLALHRLRESAGLPVRQAHARQADGPFLQAAGNRHRHIALAQLLSCPGTHRLPDRRAARRGGRRRSNAQDPVRKRAHQGDLPPRRGERPARLGAQAQRAREPRAQPASRFRRQSAA